MNYSVAIRTLGTNPDILRQELKSIFCQTILPEKVIVYIAQGYQRPDFTVGNEQYVWVKKGMVAQRALQYREIDSELLFLLDDDVEFAPDSAEKLIKALQENNADCVGVDTFRNHQMSVVSKIYAGVTNFVFPHLSERWAFKMHKNGSFSYHNNPVKDFYWSQSCAGPCSLWRKESLNKLHWDDELWLDNLGFAYGDDTVEFYKLYVNGGRLGIHFSSGVKNIDAKTASGIFQRDVKKFYVRSYASLLIWYRTIYMVLKQKREYVSAFIAWMFFAIKTIWLLLVNVMAGIVQLDARIPYYYIKGIMDGVTYAHSQDFRNIPSYLIKLP